MASFIYIEINYCFLMIKSGCMFRWIKSTRRWLWSNAIMGWSKWVWLLFGSWKCLWQCRRLKQPCLSATAGWLFIISILNTKIDWRLKLRRLKLSCQLLLSTPYTAGFITTYCSHCLINYWPLWTRDVVLSMIYYIMLCKNLQILLNLIH